MPLRIQSLARLHPTGLNSRLAPYFLHPQNPNRSPHQIHVQTAQPPAVHQVRARGESAAPLGWSLTCSMPCILARAAVATLC